MRPPASHDVEPPAPPGRRDVSLSMERVNLLAIPVAFLPLIVTLVPFYFLWGGGALLAGGKHLATWYVLVPGLLGGIVLHEAIHGVSWAVFAGKPLRSIRYGMQWKTLTPYAHCTEPMAARDYRRGAVMPALIVGAIPAVIGLAAGNGALLLYGMIFLVAAAGDFIVLWILRRVPGDTFVEDHPSRAGCYVYDRKTDNMSQPTTDE